MHLSHSLKTKYYILQAKSGFTLVELLLVMGITITLAIAGTTSYLNLRDRKALDSMAQKIAADLRGASDKSKAQENDSGWGIHFENNAPDFYQIWSGTTYASGTKLLRTNLSQVSFSDPETGLKEVIFSKGTGLPTSALTVSITNSQGEKTITVNTNGRIDY